MLRGGGEDGGGGFCRDDFWALEKGRGYVLPELMHSFVLLS